MNFGGKDMTAIKKALVVGVVAAAVIVMGNPLGMVPSPIVGTDLALTVALAAYGVEYMNMA